MKSTAKATEKRSRTVVVLAIAVALMLLGSIFAQMFNTSFYKVKVSRISFDADSGTLSGLLYMPITSRLTEKRSATRLISSIEYGAK